MIDTTPPRGAQKFPRAASCKISLSSVRSEIARRSRGRLYRYYLCTSAIRNGYASCPVRSVAAGEAETMVVAQMQGIFRTPGIAAQTIAAAAGLDDAGDAAGHEQDMIAALGRLDTIWSELFHAEQQRILHLLSERLVVKPDGFSITLRAEGVRGLAEELKPAGIGAAA